MGGVGGHGGRKWRQLYLNNNKKNNTYLAFKLFKKGDKCLLCARYFTTQGLFPYTKHLYRRSYIKCLSNIYWKNILWKSGKISSAPKYTINCC